MTTTGWPQQSLDALAYDHFRAGRFAQARQCAEQVVTGQGALLPTHGLLATVLIRLGQHREAAHVIESAMHLAHGNGDAFDALAFAATLLDDHEQANHLYAAAVEAAPGDPRFLFNLASSERNLGHLEAAERLCESTIAADGDHFPAYLLRSELRTQTADHNHVAELQRLLASPQVPDNGRMFLGYALSKELDDLDQPEDALACLKKASAIRRANLAYDVSVDEQKLRRIAAVYDAQALPATGGVAGSNFIFIIGLPRSGTTLLERILGGLSGVASNGETNNFSTALFDVAGPSPDPFAAAASADNARVTARYAELAMRGHAPGTTIVEKLPLNYLYVGAIHKALPEAKILWMRRGFLDNCLAMYRILFREGYPFSYDFEDLARYAAAYDALMTHWVKTLPGKMLEIEYERLVAKPETVARAIAEYCNLDWDAGALDLTRNTSASATASAAQIRQPIYTSSVGRGGRYGAALEPLRAALVARGLDA